MKTWSLAAGLAATVIAAPAFAVNMQVDVPQAGPQQQVVFTEHDIAKGESTGLHTHFGVEMAYVLKGTLRITILDQAPLLVHTGDSFRIEREVPHEARNIGDGPAALLITYVVDKGKPLEESAEP